MAHTITRFLFSTMEEAEAFADRERASRMPSEDLRVSVWWKDESFVGQHTWMLPPDFKAHAVVTVDRYT